MSRALVFLGILTWQGGEANRSIELVLWRDLAGVAAPSDVAATLREVIDSSGIAVKESAVTIGVANLPATCKLGELTAAVEAARATPGPDLIVARFSASSFKEVDRTALMGVQDLEPLLEWVSRQPDLRVVPAEEVASSGLTVGRARIYKELKEKGVLFGRYADELLTYPGVIRLDRMKQVGRGLAVLPYVTGALLLVGTMITLFFVRRGHRNSKARTPAASGNERNHRATHGAGNDA